MLNAQMVHDAIKAILTVSNEIDQDRTPMSVALALNSEVGELAEEIRIKHHPFHKTAGKDGIIGEAADVLIAATDLAFKTGQESILTTDVSFFVTEEGEIATDMVLGWSRDDVDFHVARSHSEEALCDISIGVGRALAIRAVDPSIMQSYMFALLNAVLNGLMQLARIEGFDGDEFTEIVTDKLEKWKTNYSK